jgi:hypothetical protein
MLQLNGVARAQGAKTSQLHDCPDDALVFGPEFALVVALFAGHELRNPCDKALGGLGHHKGKAAKSLAVELSNQPGVGHPGCRHTRFERSAGRKGVTEMEPSITKVVVALAYLDWPLKVIHDLDKSVVASTPANHGAEGESDERDLRRASDRINVGTQT